MTRLPPARVDMRGFDWPLLPLECKLHWERDAAHAGWARCLRALQDGQRRINALEKERDEQAACVEAGLRQAVDPVVHRQALRYLTLVEAHLQDAALRLRSLQQASDDARRECLARECKLETLLAARAAAMRTFMRRASLRQHKQADVAWLSWDQSLRADDGSAP